MTPLWRLLAFPFLLAIRGYRFLISPWMGRHCRFLPTCSEYAQEALRTHPLPSALALITRRVLRCHPWGGSGLDPVPPWERGSGHRGSQARTRRSCESSLQAGGGMSERSHAGPSPR
jgi:putative membrane protein insertion efficiency factor